MSRTFYAVAGLALMLLIAFAPALVGSSMSSEGASAPSHDAPVTASAVDRAVEDLAAWPVAATR